MRSFLVLVICLVLVWGSAHNVIELLNFFSGYKEVKKSEKEEVILVLKRVFNIPTYELARDIYDVAVDEGLDPFLFTSLIYTESSFKSDAISVKGYHGLSQIPYKIPPKYNKANLVIGAKIFKEKLEIARGDLALAILYYKGYKPDSKRGHLQARKVLILAYSAKEKAKRIGSIN